MAKLIGMMQKRRQSVGCTPEAMKAALSKPTEERAKVGQGEKDGENARALEIRRACVSGLLVNSRSVEHHSQLSLCFSLRVTTTAESMTLECAFLSFL